MARILVVDDDSDIRFVARLALKRGQHEITLAESGRAALAHLDTGAPCDLILCDRMMPEMSGLETLAEVRKRTDRAATPFVFLTAKAQKDEIDEGLRLGATRYLTKPFEPKELLAEVNGVLAP
jgi:two-component system sensor histidine kinase/response regulator